MNTKRPDETTTVAACPPLSAGLGLPKIDTEVSDIVRDWLKLNGFDGLCHGETECGCNFDDFIICQGEGSAFPQCRPAYKFAKRSGDWWMSTNKNWRESEDDDA